MSGVDHPGSPRRRRWRIVALVTLLLAVVTSPVTLAALAFWAADGSWEFAGGGFRHWVFIKGSTVDRLGFVAATGGPGALCRPSGGRHRSRRDFCGLRQRGHARGRRRRLRRALPG